MKIKTKSISFRYREPMNFKMRNRLVVGFAITCYARQAETHVFLFLVVLMKGVLQVVAWISKVSQIFQTFCQ
jgi:hypothetical protein